MRLVILAPSVYSETACAVAMRLAEHGHVLSGALVLSTLNRTTLVRKIAQWGLPGTLHYAQTKLIARQSDQPGTVHNQYLLPLLTHGDKVIRSLREVAALHAFPVAICRDQNAPGAVALLKQWSPDVIIFAGGDILRRPLLDVPRLGVLNMHLGLLPEVRGMSSPEWSLLKNCPVGITIHYIDAGIDTGPILRRYEFPEAMQCETLSNLRNALIAFAIGKMAEVVSELDCGLISASQQRDMEEDNQFFVMHEWLQARAGECLAASEKRL